MYVNLSLFGLSHPNCKLIQGDYIIYLIVNQLFKWKEVNEMYVVLHKLLLSTGLNFFWKADILNSLHMNAFNPGQQFDSTSTDWVHLCTVYRAEHLGMCKDDPDFPGPLLALSFPLSYCLIKKQMYLSLVVHLL